ncbi:MAG: hypothetical protein ACK5UQ_02310 [Planctomycetota bacterium]
MKKKRKKLGRPRSRMTPKTVAAILEGVAGCLPIDVAARAAGVAPSTVRSHRERHRDFATALDAAIATAKSSMVARVRDAAPKDWKAAAWMLERRFPEEFARPEIRATIATANIDTGELTKGILAGLSMIAARWAPMDEPDVEDVGPSPIPADPDSPRVVAVDGVLIDNATGAPLPANRIRRVNGVLIDIETGKPLPVREAHNTLSRS